MPEEMLAYLRSFAFTLAFLASVVLFGIACLPVLLAPPRTVAAVLRAWSRTVLWSLRVCTGIRAEIQGRDHLPPTPCLIASKHQSTWETIVFNLLLDNPAFVLKRELLRLPVYGWYAWRAGHIPIDRQGGARAMRRMLRAADKAVRGGRSVIIFPEGTRVAPGQTRPYHPGVAGLYRHLRVPVVPVAVNSGLFWGRRRFLKKPGTITLRFLPPIPPGLERSTFLAELERRIEDATNALIDARGGAH
ncbi:MAG: 1-acyl-sn-glycerol-3-phosphate acyltransferase [Alphaproteobacteria bacterium]|nr:MAG: 1-acyl-sn-glycerol-3-phosphate acyltransferase [Alphaproteobacteria bacterium]